MNEVNCEFGVNVISIVVCDPATVTLSILIMYCAETGFWPEIINGRATDEDGIIIPRSF
jgi:hypothetical protein